MTGLNEILLRMNSLSVLRDLLDDKVLSALRKFLSIAAENEKEKISAYGEFVYSLYSTGTESLSGYIQKIVYESENAYVKAAGQNSLISDLLDSSFRKDLRTFEMIAGLTPEDLSSEMTGYDFLPGWYAENVDIEKQYFLRIKDIRKYGYGIYAKHRMFYIDESGNITPVKNPDSTILSDLIDYEREQKIILDNTKALLAGSPAANILLTGDAGTGKSSTIKAVCNELADEGLRIIEVRKEQLHSIPGILDDLSINPLKFILFIDDLSFSSDDDNFSALKAILEGSVSAKSGNVVIYSTSNRRHLVKESFSDREGDDIHFNDTMQEILSLSERFGIHLTFSRPDKATYLDIVHNLAEKHSIEYNAEKLDIAAEKFALKKGTRSARAAKQFIDGILAGNGENIV